MNSALAYVIKVWSALTSVSSLSINIFIDEKLLVSKQLAHFARALCESAVNARNHNINTIITTYYITFTYIINVLMF
jgi:hypothetical protein